MKTRRFVVYSFIYVILVASLVYVLNNKDYNLAALGYELNLPIAVWFAIPVILFALFAILHIVFHSISFYNYKRSIKRDTQLYNEFVKEIFLALPSNKDFKTDTHKISSAVTRLLSPWGLYKDVNVHNDELLAVISSVKSVQNGEIADLKKYKLSKENPLYIQNEINKVKNLKDYYLEILKNDSFSEAVDKEAFDKLISCGNFADIRKYSFDVKSSADIMKVIERYVNDEISMSTDEIYEFLNNDKISATQYTKAAIMLKDKLKPESYKSLFEKLKSGHQDAEQAYLYVLYELVLLDELRELLQTSDDHEFIEFKTLLFLRDNAKPAPAYLFFK